MYFRELSLYAYHKYFLKIYLQRIHGGFDYNAKIIGGFNRNVAKLLIKTKNNTIFMIYVCMSKEMEESCLTRYF